MRLTQGIHRAVQIHADHPALLGDGFELTWRQFADRVARLAGVLIDHGVEPGGRVAMLAANSPRYVEYYFATLWAGGVMVPVNTRWAIPEKVHCLNDSGATVLLVDAAAHEEADHLRRLVCARPRVATLSMALTKGWAVVDMALAIASIEMCRRCRIDALTL